VASDVLKDCNAFVFWVREPGHDDEGATFPQNIRNHSPSKVASHSKRPESSCLCLSDEQCSLDVGLGGSNGSDYEYVMLYQTKRHCTLEDNILVCHPCCIYSCLV
jgi:hypothetical protein